jgi:uncharacterized protein YidB (DUF937 family)
MNRSALWSGFADELQKISAATGVSDVIKQVSTSPKLPKLVAKQQPEGPAPHPDPTSSAKMTPPPPVTVGG